MFGRRRASPLNEVFYLHPLAECVRGVTLFNCIYRSFKLMQHGRLHLRPSRLMIVDYEAHGIIEAPHDKMVFQRHRLVNAAQVFVLDPSAHQ